MSKNLNDKSFFTREAKDVANDLLGKFICRRFEDGTVKRWCITETEAYDGKEEVTYDSDIFCGTGKWCFYYGMLMINCKNENSHDNVLLRATDCIKGPFNLGKELKIKEIMNEINGQDVLNCPLLWLEDWGVHAEKGKPRKRVRVQKKEKNMSKAEAEKVEKEVKEEKNFFAKALNLPCFPERLSE